MKYVLLSAAVATIAIVSPVSAQEVITNPGRCAQYYPNSNCQNLGPGNPFTDRYGRGGWSRGYAQYVPPRRHYRRWREY